MERHAESGMFESSHPDFARQASKEVWRAFLLMGFKVRSRARRGRPQLPTLCLRLQMSPGNRHSEMDQAANSSVYLQMPFTYIIQSDSTGRWYFGSTSNLEERIEYHNRGWNTSTKGRGPWKLVFVRAFSTIEEAREFEFHLKKVRNNSFISRKFKEYFIGNSPA